MSKYGTAFVESELFLAATEQDRTEIKNLLVDMTDGELHKLYLACNFLSGVVLVFKEDHHDRRSY